MESIPALLGSLTKKNNNQRLLMALCCTLISAPSLLHHHQRGFLLQKTRTNTEIHSQTLCRERKRLEHTSLSGLSPSNPFPSEFREGKDEGHSILQG